MVPKAQATTETSNDVRLVLVMTLVALEPPPPVAEANWEMAPNVLAVAFAMVALAEANRPNSIWPSLVKVLLTVVAAVAVWKKPEPLAVAVALSDLVTKAIAVPLIEMLPFEELVKVLLAVAAPLTNAWALWTPPKMYTWARASVSVANALALAARSMVPSLVKVLDTVLPTVATWKKPQAVAFAEAEELTSEAKAVA